jgi:Tol biopolymer transport system component
LKTRIREKGLLSSTKEGLFLLTFTIMRSLLHDRSRLFTPGIAIALAGLLSVSGCGGGAGGATLPPVPLDRILFDTFFDNDSEIFAVNANGTAPLPLTSNTFPDTEPAYNASGSKIVFVSQRDGNAEIYVMNNDGTGQTRLTNNIFEDDSPVFTPDGTIVFRSTRD